MKIAVFPGSFDPFTYAHYDLVQRALPLFDQMIIAIGINTAKQGLMSFEARESAIRALFSGEASVKVATFQGLTVHFCQTVGARYMLRGLRNAADFEFENAIAQNNLLLNPDIETCFLSCRSGMGHISSTIVRDILRHGGDITTLVPAEVRRYLDTTPRG